MSLWKNDPRFLKYLGAEMSADEILAFEKDISENPEMKRALDEIRTFESQIKEVYLSEPGSSLSKQEIVNILKSGKKSYGFGFFRFPKYLASGMIVLVVVGTVSLQMAGRIFGGLDRAKIKSAQKLIRTFSHNLEIYRKDCSQFPTTKQGLQALVESPTIEPICKTWGPSYVKDVPSDPWGQSFIYESDGKTFKIISYGADKKEGGKDAGKDIVYEKN